MAPAGNLSTLFDELRALDAISHRAGDLTSAGTTILNAILRHTSCEAGLVYLRDATDGSLRLAAWHLSPAGADILPAEAVEAVADGLLLRDSAPESPLWKLMPPGAAVAVPLRYGKSMHGLLILAATSEDEQEIVRAAAVFVTALLVAQRLTTEAREGDFQLKYRLWELESLYDIGLSIASTLDLEQVADEILVRTISLLNARRAALYLRSDERFILHRAYGEVRSQFFDEELSPEIARTLTEEGGSLQLREDADCIFPGCSSLIALPIRSNERVIGVLAAGDRELREGGVGPFQENDLRLLSLFANQAAIALENARLHREALDKQAMERELELAATIQRDILPRALPEVPGFEIATLSRPARQLGGDYHALFERDGTLTVCVADVSGKSMPAAILVSALHAALQLLFSEGRELGNIATELNRHIHNWSAENKFITLFLATIEPATQLIRYVNAGHNPPFLLSDGRVDALASHGLPIGILARTKYTAQTRAMTADSLLAIYSDGITEAENDAGDEFGGGRLERLFEELRDEPLTVIRTRVADEVAAFERGAQKDDQTLLLVRVGAA